MQAKALLLPGIRLPPLQPRHIAVVAALTAAAVVPALSALQAHPHAEYVLSGPRLAVAAFVIATPAAWLASQLVRRIARAVRRSP